MDTLARIKEAAEAGKIMPTTGENATAWLEGGFLPNWALQAIGELVAEEAWTELDNRFYKYMAFGTGGMRGRTIGEVTPPSERGELSALGSPAHASVGSAYLNDFNVVRATMGLYRYCAEYLQQAMPSSEERVPKLVIARDVRHFSQHFSELAASTWTQLGGHAFLFDGPRATPHLSFAVRYLQATAGVVITASHNPPHDNGFKAYFQDGGQVVPPHDKGIIAQVEKIQLANLKPYLEVKMGAVVTLGEEVDRAYEETVRETLLAPDLIAKAKPKVVFTPIHGTGGVASVPLLRSAGADVVTVEEQMAFDPRFPTVKSPNPENAEALAMAIEQAQTCGADAVMATDPDADRMGVAVRGGDRQMHLLTGNMIGSLLLEYRIRMLKEQGVLPPSGTPRAAVIKTFVTTPLQAAIAQAHGLKVLNTLTGFKWIGEKLRHYEEALQSKLAETGQEAIDYDATPLQERRKLLLEHSTYYVFGGEESYGYLATDRIRDKDANQAVLLFAELAAYLKSKGRTFTDFLDELYVSYGYFREDLVNLYFEGASGAGKIKKILNGYREDPPKGFAGLDVTRIIDFSRDDLRDADGEEIPKETFFILELDNGYSFAVRGSGTEPKIKFYVFAREDVSEPTALADAKERARRTIDELKKAIEEDARQRAEG